LPHDWQTIAPLGPSGADVHGQSNACTGSSPEILDFFIIVALSGMNNIMLGP